MKLALRLNCGESAKIYLRTNRKSLKGPEAKTFVGRVSYQQGSHSPSLRGQQGKSFETCRCLMQEKHRSKETFKVGLPLAATVHVRPDIEPMML